MRDRLSPAVLLASLLLALAAVCPADARTRVEDPPPEQQRALLDLVVNEISGGQVLVLVRTGDVLVPVDALERAGLRGLEGRREVVGGQTFVSLASLAPDVSYRLDEAALTLRITAAPGSFGTSRFDVKGLQRPEYTFSRANSAFLNYGVNWFQRSGYTLTAEAGVSVQGALASTTLTRNERGELTRGLSSLVIDDRSRLRRVTAGDSYVSDRLLGGSLFLGGLRVAREYSVDPYFVQFPMLGLSGAATTPSTVEIYVDNRLVRQERVQPGQFELANVPVPNGASQTRVVVRDAFGREQQISSPFYLSTSALARGLHEYEYAVGFERENVGVPDDDYGRPVVFAQHRYGFSDSVTAGLRIEAREDLISGGPALNLRLPVGEVELSAAASREDGRNGLAGAVGYAYTMHGLNVGANVRVYDEAYSTLSRASMADRTRSSLNVYAGLQLPGVPGLSVQHSRSETYGGTRLSRTAMLVNTQIGRRLYAFANFGWTDTESRRRADATVGVSVSLGGQSSAMLATSFADSGATTSLDLQRSLPIGGGYGYQFHGGTGEDGTRGRIEYQGRHGRVAAGHESVGGVSGTSLAASGAVVAIGGALFASRPVEDGFAVIRVPGVKGVRGYLSNQEVGRTNGRGDLLVPNVLPYYANRLGISDQDVPLDRGLTGTERAVATPYRGGAVVVFDAEQVKGVTGTITLAFADRTVVPEFGDLVVSVGDREVESPIGHQGVFYLEGLAAGRYTATVRHHGSACSFSIVVPATAAPVADLGAVRCAMQER
jgi:outer membrane usher protein